MKIKAVSVRCFELFHATTGESLGLFRVKDSWRGMAELESVDRDGETAIVNDPSSIFDAIFGEQRSEVDVFKASPDFVFRAGYAGAEAATE